MELRTIIYKGPPIDVEGFPKGAKRSCEGSLPLLPGPTRDVTADELAFLLSKKLNVVDITPKKAVVEGAPSAPPPPPSPPATKPSAGKKGGSEQG